ncbi:hypothetical protein [Methylocucumis oryzae]|uniref:Uncharacterized protein n=1 Tax=Methylocucumis oryzae TaxID=1632867 RepID=A0A0F3IR61_9GAMM|nr:hypothetical protein [Methylocucumis oryzae]KJV08074.1 hypothetical protein VZ94_00505 [Methylocucumis oryzae]
MIDVLSKLRVNPPSDIWANRAALAAFGAGIYRFTDIGTTGSLWYYDGATWLQVGSIPLMSKSEGYIVASLTGATYSQTGTTITVTLANHRLTSALNGRLIYLTGTGGILSGWYKFTFVSTSQFTCYWPVEQSITGNISNSSGEYVFDIANVALPSGFFSNRTVEIRARFRYENGAVSTKNPRLYLNSTLLLTHTIANNIAASAVNWELSDNGENAQTAFMNSGNLGTGTVGTSLENTGSSSCTIRISVNLALSLTWACLDFVEAIL